MINLFKNLFKTNIEKTEVPTTVKPVAAESSVAKPAAKTENKTPKPRKPKKPKSVQKTAKELATERNEPYINIVSIELDPTNIGNGAFELDWNDKFVANLVRAGYVGKTDQQIVDQWFQEVCRNILLENYEQEQADPERRQLNRRRLDDNRTEFS